VWWWTGPTREAAAGSSRLAGTGVGEPAFDMTRPRLYIASEIARAHGGTLEVASTAEETRFTFRMAVARSPG